MSALPPPRPFPPDARLLFGIGAQKAGTTWLAEVLAQSDQCHFTVQKELHYFDVWSGRDASHLASRMALLSQRTRQLSTRPAHGNRHLLDKIGHLSQLLSIYTGREEPGHPHRHYPYFGYLLQDWQAQPVVCDFTPSYALLDTATFAEMGGIGAPGRLPLFVFVMRDPVARMWSQVRMLKSVEGLTGQSLMAACVDHIGQLEQSGRLARAGRADYQRTIRSLEAAVPPDRIHYAFYETLFDPSQTQAQVDALCRFAGIRPVSVDPLARVNPGVAMRIPSATGHILRAAFAPQYRFVHDRFGAAVPPVWGSMAAVALP